MSPIFRRNSEVLAKRRGPEKKGRGNENEDRDGRWTMGRKQEQRGGKVKSRSKSEEYRASGLEPSEEEHGNGHPSRKRVPFRGAAGGLGRKEGCEVGKGSNRSASIM